MKRPVSFVWVDVFAEQPAGGNPLAVLDGSDLPRRTRSAAHPRTQPGGDDLLLSPTAGSMPTRVRIFSQTTEIPFAGHPVLGTAAALLLLQKLPFKTPRPRCAWSLASAWSR